MKKTNKAFSLIEIIISTIILTIWVFGVYKLMWNNINLLSNSETYKEANSLYFPFKECLKSFWYDNLSSYNSWETFWVNFKENNMWCATWSYNNNFDFSWVTIQNKNYYLYSEVIQKDAINLKLKINIFNDTTWFLFKSWVLNDNQILIITKN